MVLKKCMKDIKDFKKTQEAELESWFSSDPKIEKDKRIREIIRYPLLKKQMGLNHLDTSDMVVWDIGCGPYGGVSTLLTAKEIQRFDPLMDEYRKHFPINNGFNIKAEDLNVSPADLIIITNAFDHFEDPHYFFKKLVRDMHPGAYFAHLHAIDNAYSHPHKAHAHNVNPEMFNQFLSNTFETVWYMDYNQDGLTYGWRKQPAFAGLYRKVVGYNAS